MFGYLRRQFYTLICPLVLYSKLKPKEREYALRVAQRLGVGLAIYRSRVQFLAGPLSRNVT